MMKKIFLILISLLFINLFNFPKFILAENKLFFYIPDEEQMKYYLNMYQYLLNCDSGKVNMDDVQFDKMYSNLIGKETFQSLLYESFLRHTKNKKIRNQLINYIKKNKINNSFTESLERLYNSKEVKIQNNKNDQIQYNYNEKYFDENINLFNQNESSIFDKELGLMLFDNKWAQINFNSKDKKDNNRDSFFLMYGGGTNSMNIRFERYSNTSFEKFKNEQIERVFHKNNIDWKVQELKKEGILARSGADKIFIGSGVGPDVIPEIDTATFTIYLYNEKMQKGYLISYFMNFSKINNNYVLRNRIWNQLLMQLTLSFINVK